MLSHQHGIHHTGFVAWLPVFVVISWVSVRETSQLLTVLCFKNATAKPAMTFHSKLETFAPVFELLLSRVVFLQWLRPIR